jgi:hypothetical protein
MPHDIQRLVKIVHYCIFSINGSWNSTSCSGFWILVIYLFFFPLVLPPTSTILIALPLFLVPSYCIDTRCLAIIVYSAWLAEPVSAMRMFEVMKRKITAIRIGPDRTPQRAVITPGAIGSTVNTSNCPITSR